MTKNNLLITTLLATALILSGCKKESPPVPPNSKWIAGIAQYNPAPGQFINTELGKPITPMPIVGGRTGTLSLGGYGGYVIFHFQTQVKNIPGVDFCIMGNAFDGSSEPGAVVAIVDKNGDNTFTPDEMYLLVGSEHDKSQKMTITYTRPADMTKAADVAWTTSLGQTGKITAQPQYHTQSYFPTWTEGNTLAFTGLLAPYAPVWDSEKWVMPALASGYADNYSADYETIVGNDPDTRNSNKFDLDNAIDYQGKSVKLTEAHFIMVYTCVNAEAGAVGEISTEVCGAINLSANM